MVFSWDGDLSKDSKTGYSKDKLVDIGKASIDVSSMEGFEVH
jgi:hypothetical protein